MVNLAARAGLRAGILMTLALTAAAQDNHGAQSPTAAEALKAAKERWGAERLVAREEFFAQRRQNPADRQFDVNQALLAARAARAAQPEALLPGPLAGSVWVPIGPAPSTNGQTPQDFAQPSPVSGRLTDIVLDPVNGAVFAGGAQGGLWKSTDNGASWTPLADGLGSLATGSIAMDPANHDVLYYGTGEGNLSADSYAGVGVFKSTDNGASWAGPLGTAEFRGRSVSSLVVDRTNSQVVLAGTSSGVCGVGAVVCGSGLPTRGIFKSTDGGSTWAKKTSPAGMAADVRASILFQDPLVATRWYAAMSNTDTTSGGLWLSTDGGETWASLNGVGGFPALALPASGINRYWMTGGAAPAAVQSTLYVGTGNNNASTARGGRIYKSTDSGATWAQLTAANDYCMGQCFYDLPVYAVPNNPAVVFHGGAGAVDTSGTTKSNLRRSTDGGATFADVMRSADNTTAVHSDTHAIVTDPANASIVWTGNDGGIWRSTDSGVNWQNRNTNLQLTQFTAFDVLLSDPANRSYGGTQDNGTMGWRGTATDGVAWPHLDFGDGGFAAQDQGNPNNLVHTYFNQTNNLIGVGCTTGGFAVTQGGYGTSLASGNGIAIADRVAFYAPLHLDRGTGAATQTLYFGTHRIWRAPGFFTTGCGGGSVFTSLSGATDLLGGTGYFTAIETKANAAAGSNADVVCGGSSTGRVFCTANANAGAPTWTERDAALSPKLYVSDVVIDPNVAWNPGTTGTAWVARSGFYGSVTGNQVRKTTDGGVTWSTSGSGIPDIPVNAIALDPLVPNRLWAGTDVGAYVSSDGGATWAPYGTGLPNAAVFDVKASPLPAGLGAVLLVTHGRGAFRLSPLTPVELQDLSIE